MGLCSRNTTFQVGRPLMESRSTRAALEAHGSRIWTETSYRSASTAPEPHRHRPFDGLCVGFACPKGATAVAGWGN